MGAQVAVSRVAAQGATIRRAGGAVTAIRTVADLRARCEIEGTCWIWSGCRRRDGSPALRICGVDKALSLGSAICRLRTGRAPKRGVVWHCTCDTPHCANPRHRTPGTRSSQMLAAKLRRGPLTRARIAAAKRAASTLSEADVASIRLADSPLGALAEQYGISVSHVSNIRSGKSRRRMCAPGASVFDV